MTATTPEGLVKAKVDAIIAKHSNIIINPTTKGYGKSGASDKITCIKGVFVAIEVKSEQAKGYKRFPTKLQFRFLSNVLQNYGAVAVINESNVDELDEWLAEVTDRGSNARKFLVFKGCPHPTKGAEVTEVSSG